MAIKTVVFTTSTNYTIPGDFVQLVSVDVIGPGARTSNINGGAGGSYAQSTSVANIQPGGSAYLQVGNGSYFPGSGGQPDSWFSYGIGNTAPTSPTNGALAPGGAGGATPIGTTLASGGSGGTGYFILGSSNYGGGGGAAGPNGAGGNGGDGGTGGGGGGGGAQSGSVGGNGTASTGGQGGNGPDGTGGGVGAAPGPVFAQPGTAGTGGGGGGGAIPIGGSNLVNAGAGATGNTYTDTSTGLIYGPGGGGGGSAAGSSNTAAGGAYGGGAGGSNENPRPNGGDGLVVFIYSTTPLNTGNFLALF